MLSQFLIDCLFHHVLLNVCLLTDLSTRLMLENRASKNQDLHGFPYGTSSTSASMMNASIVTLVYREPRNKDSTIGSLT